MLNSLADGLANKLKHNKISGPTFINENGSDDRLEMLRYLRDNVGDDQKDIIDREIKLIEIGAKGEDNVIYELKHSKTNMLILHDITLKDSYKDSQIDFLILTKSAIIVLETKRLVGDIEINSDGDFTRYYKNAQGKVYKKEGIYSPITQNQYHIDAVRDLLVANKLIKDLPFYSLVVIANSKTVINKIYAKKEIKEKIIKYDQLNQTINSIINKPSNCDISDSRMVDIADLLLTYNEPRKYDYVKKLNLKLINNDEQAEDIKVIETTNEKNSVDDKLYEALRTYRYNKANELSYKPYYVFNDKQLGELVLRKPKTKEEFMTIHGFGEGKYNMYGNDIIKIILSDDGITVEDTTKSNDEPDKSNNEVLIKKLKQFRMQQCTADNVKPYIIFNNAEMDDLMAKMPKTKEELLKVRGFNQNKVDRFGDKLLKVLNS